MIARHLRGLAHRSPCVNLTTYAVLASQAHDACPSDARLFGRKPRPRACTPSQVPCHGPRSWWASEVSSPTPSAGAGLAAGVPCAAVAGGHVPKQRLCHRWGGWSTPRDGATARRVPSAARMGLSHCERASLILYNILPLPGSEEGASHRRPEAWDTPVAPASILSRRQGALVHESPSGT